MNDPSVRSVLIVGGGIAGSVCAIRLRQLGVDVTLAEKETFPRSKVCGCCLGGAGLQAFDGIGLREWLIERGVKTNRWKSSLGKQMVELDLPDGVAVSRQTLDTDLLDHARSLNARVLQPCRISMGRHDQTTTNVTLHQDGQRTQSRFGLIIMAGGLNSADLNRMLPWQRSPHGPFGTSFQARIDGIEPAVIYMACDDDGYVGLVKLEDGRVDVAAALTSGSEAAGGGSPRQRVDAILKRSHFERWKIEEESAVMTTPPLRRSRAAGAGRLLAIGDAAGYVEPFTGEGMTWAAESAIAAADFIASQNDWSDLGDRWNHQSRSLLRRKKLACRAITTTLRSASVRRFAGVLLSQWPSLAHPLVQSLNR
ncbi:MAG: NAD(P)/FAD-dependent oxidoreductase [Planctomycetota bacterium]